MKGFIRLAAWCLALALITLPVIGVLRGWFAAGRWPITQLTVQAEFRHLTGPQIRDAVRPNLGKGFFALDLEHVRQSVAALAWVESVEASKRWPNTLLLRIYERQPFARWNAHQLISREGQLFAAPDAQISVGLPQLQGPDAQLAEVVGFYAETLRAFRNTPIHITGVALTERGSWSLSTASGAQIVLGDRDQAAARLQRFLDVYPQVLAGHTSGFAYADLRYTNGFAVRWSPPTPDPHSAADAPPT